MTVEVLKEDGDFLEVLLQGEDLGLANRIVEELLQNKSVSFAAAKLDHPIKGNPIITVKSKDAKKELSKAVASVAKDLQGIKVELEKVK